MFLCTKIGYRVRKSAGSSIIYFFLQAQWFLHLFLVKRICKCICYRIQILINAWCQRISLKNSFNPLTTNVPYHITTSQLMHGKSDAHKILFTCYKLIKLNAFRIVIKVNLDIHDQSIGSNATVTSQMKHYLAERRIS